MKFACPNCKTRYSIADEKLPSGGTIKFKCKVCSTSVRLKRKSTTPKEAPQPSSFSGEATKVAPLGQLKDLQKQAATQTPSAAPAPAPQPMGADDAATAVVSYDELNSLRSKSASTPPPPGGPKEWFVLVGGKQEGPFDATEVQGRLERKEIDKRTFVWKSGMKDWQRLAQVAVFRELASQTGDASWRVVKSKAAESAKQAPAQSPAPAQDPATIFDEPTTAMPATDLRKHVQESTSRGDPNDPFDTSTSLMDTSELQRQLARSASDDGGDLGGELPFDSPEPDTSPAPSPVPFGDDDETRAEPVGPGMFDNPTVDNVDANLAAELPGASLDMDETPEPYLDERTTASKAVEISPATASSFKAETQQSSFPSESEISQLEPAFESNETGELPGDDDETGQSESPAGFHKAATQVASVGTEFDAAAALTGEPTGDGMSRDVSASASTGVNEADPFGHIDDLDDGGDDDFDPLSNLASGGSLDDAVIEEPIVDAFDPDDGPPPGGAEDGYHDAPPGEHTRVFMATAGIYQRRRRNKFWGVFWTLILLVVGGGIGLDVAGIYKIPGMGIAYDLTGLEDPNAERALERAQDDLDDPDLSPEEREAKRKRIAALQAKLQGKGKGAGKRPRKRNSGTAKKGAPSEGERGIAEAEGSTEESKEEASNIFNDSRKKSSNVKLASAQELQTPNLPEGLTQEAIFKVIQENVNSMKLCFAEAARKGEKLSGKMEVQLTIAATGAVTDAAINTAEFKSSTMGSCTVKRVKNWKFPRFNGDPVTVVFPYVLQLGF